VECIWLEIFLKNKKLLYGTFYRPTNSSPSVLSQIEMSIGPAFDTTISDIVITGDFNFDMQKHTSAAKINSIATQYNLTQVIQQPTHYTVSSNSLIDLFLVLMNCRVSVSGVADPFLDQVCRYHCPIFCILDSSKPSSQNFKRKVWLYDKGDYVGLRREISLQLNIYLTK
jgi:hypothetical protein